MFRRVSWPGSCRDKTIAKHRNILHAFVLPGESMKVTWLGHSAFLIEGNDRVLVDPYLTGNTKASTTADKVSCDIICVAHGHGDHLGDTVEIARRNDATVAGIIDVSNVLARRGGS